MHAGGEEQRDSKGVQQQPRGSEYSAAQEQCPQLKVRLTL